MSSSLHSALSWSAHRRLGRVAAVTACACTVVFCVSIQRRAPVQLDAGLPAPPSAVDAQRKAAAGAQAPSRWDEYWMEVSKQTDAP